MYHIAEDGEFLCPFSQIGCSDTLPDRGLYKHINHAHHSDRIPCPFRAKLICQATFIGLGPVRSHVKVVHKKIRFSCTWADKTDCESTYTSKSDVMEHVRAQHEGQLTVCAWASKTDCKAAFMNRAAMVAHVKAVHEEQSFLCTWADKSHCRSTFKTAKHMRRHVMRNHRGQNILCPYAKMESCKAKLKNKSSLATHVSAVHGNNGHSDYHAPEIQYDKTFKDERDAKTHADHRTHENMRYLCPHAMKAECNQVFKTKSEANMHVETACERTQSACRMIEEEDHTAGSLTKKYTLRHAKGGQKEKSYPCPLAEKENCAA